MKLIIVHYHLRPGGIRRVIELATPHLLRAVQTDGDEHPQVLPLAPDQANIIDKPGNWLAVQRGMIAVVDAGTAGWPAARARAASTSAAASAAFAWAAFSSASAASASARSRASSASVTAGSGDSGAVMRLSLASGSRPGHPLSPVP